MKTNSFILALIMLVSCSSQNDKNILLPKKIFVDNMKQPSYIYYNGEKIEFYESRKSECLQTIMGWLNKADILLMGESSKSYLGETYYDRLYTVDLKKNVIDTIYNANLSKDEIISAAYISPNDSIIVINLNHKPEKKDAEGWFYSPMDILVVDYKTKKVIDRINNFYFYNIHFNQSLSYIFSPNSKQFVYSISDKMNWFSDKREKYDLKNKRDNGIYIYDLVNKEHKKIAYEGIYPIWSPNKDIIAYYTNKDLWFYNTKNQMNTIFYKVKDNQKIEKILWTPDGNSIFLFIREKNLFSGKILFPILLDIKDKTEYKNGELDKLGLIFFWK